MHRLNLLDVFRPVLNKHIHVTMYLPLVNILGICAGHTNIMAAIVTTTQASVTYLKGAIIRLR